MKAISESSVLKICSASSAPSPAEGRVEMIVSGMRQALVQDAEHEVDRDQRRDDQQRLRADRLPIGARVAGIFGMQRVGKVQLGHRLVDHAASPARW